MIFSITNAVPFIHQFFTQPSTHQKLHYAVTMQYTSGNVSMLTGIDCSSVILSVNCLNLEERLGRNGNGRSFAAVNHLATQMFKSTNSFI